MAWLCILRRDRRDDIAAAEIWVAGSKSLVDYSRDPV